MTLSKRLKSNTQQILNKEIQAKSKRWDGTAPSAFFPQTELSLVSAQSSGSLIGGRWCQSEQRLVVRASAVLGSNQVKEIFRQEKKLMLEFSKTSEGHMKVRRHMGNVFYVGVVNGRQLFIVYFSPWLYVLN